MRKLRVRLLYGVIISFAIGALYATPARAELAVAINTDKLKVGMDDTLKLEVVISGKGARTSRLEIEGIDNFEVLSKSSRQQVSIINSRISVSSTYSYILRPLATLAPPQGGRTVELRARVEANGEVYKSNTEKVQLVKSSGGGGSRPPGAPPGFSGRKGSGGLFGYGNNFFGMFGNKRFNDDDFLAQANVSKPRVYAGQEVIYTLSFYRATEIQSRPDFFLPDMKGFWTEQPPDRKRVSTRSVEIAGRRYMAIELVAIIYPISAGNTVIGKGKVRFQPDFFASPIELESREITLNVLSLPEEGKPEDFSGLVGEFQIDAGLKVKPKAKTKEVIAEVGRPITLIVKVSGAGNLHAIKEPSRPELEGFETYEPETDDDISRSSKGSRGSRSFTYILVPQREGKLEIGVFETSYFDPEKGEYRRIRTEPMVIEVAPGAQAGLGRQGGQAAHPARQDIERFSTNIRHIKPDDKRLGPQGRPYYKRAAFYIYPALLMAALGAYVVYINRRRKLLSDSEYARNVRAKRMAKERLDSAGKYLRENDSEGFYGEMDRAVRQYMADKFNVSPSGISRETVREIFNEKLSAINGNTIDTVSRILSKCESARFAGKSVNAEAMKKLLEDARTVILEMEKEIK
ncbi:MAG: BatD family protein [Nitrospinota bacterium]